MSTYEWERTGQEGQIPILRFFKDDRGRRENSQYQPSHSRRRRPFLVDRRSRELFSVHGHRLWCFNIRGGSMRLRVDRVRSLGPSVKPVAVVVRQLYKCSVVGHKTKQDECTFEQDKGRSQGCSQTSSPNLLARAQILQQCSHDPDCVLP